MSSLLIGSRTFLCGYSDYQPNLNLPQEFDCGVCLETKKTRDALTELACKHILCTPCVEETVRKANSKCPLCRADIEVDEELLEGTELRKRYVEKYHKLAARFQETNDPKDRKSAFWAKMDVYGLDNLSDARIRLRGTDEQVKLLKEKEAKIKEADASEMRHRLLMERIEHLVVGIVKGLFILGLITAPIYFISKKLE